MLNAATTIPYSRASEKELAIFNVQDCPNKISYTDQTFHARSSSVPAACTAFYSQNKFPGSFSVHLILEIIFSFIFTFGESFYVTSPKLFRNFLFESTMLVETQWPLNCQQEKMINNN